MIGLDDCVMKTNGVSVPGAEGKSTLPTLVIKETDKSHKNL